MAQNVDSRVEALKHEFENQRGPRGMYLLSVLWNSIEADSLPRKGEGQAPDDRAKRASKP